MGLLCGRLSCLTSRGSACSITTGALGSRCSSGLVGLALLAAGCDTVGLSGLGTTRSTRAGGRGSVARDGGRHRGAATLLDGVGRRSSGNGSRGRGRQTTALLGGEGLSRHGSLGDLVGGRNVLVVIILVIQSTVQAKVGLIRVLELSQADDRLAELTDSVVAVVLVNVAANVRLDGLVDAAIGVSVSVQGPADNAQLIVTYGSWGGMSSMISPRPKKTDRPSSDSITRNYADVIWGVWVDAV